MLLVTVVPVACWNVRRVSADAVARLSQRVRMRGGAFSQPRKRRPHNVTRPCHNSTILRPTQRLVFGGEDLVSHYVNVEVFQEKEIMLGLEKQH